MTNVSGPSASPNAGFEDLAWLFTCDSRNRGLIRQGFDEAALLWKAVKATSGNILEIGRNFGGSTVLLAAAAPDREIYSIDNRSHEDAACKNFLTQAANKQRVHLLITDSRKSLPDFSCGFLFIDGDHSFDGVLADVIAHWDSVQTHGGGLALAAFHDAVPNNNFKWRDAERRLHRISTSVKNKFRKRQKPVVAPDYEPGVRRVCEELVRQGAAAGWKSAGSMLVLQKLTDLPANFAKLARESTTK